jgi:hypothetical protein
MRFPCNSAGFSACSSLFLKAAPEIPETCPQNLSPTASVLVVDRGNRRAMQRGHLRVVTALLCHGVSALIDVQLSNGAYLVEGRTVTGFANVEEDYVDRAVGQKVMPYRIEDELRKRGANYIQGAVQGLCRARRAPDHGPAAVLGREGRGVGDRRARSLKAVGNRQQPFANS